MQCTPNAQARTTSSENFDTLMTPDILIFAPDGTPMTEVRACAARRAQGADTAHARDAEARARGFADWAALTAAQWTCHQGTLTQVQPDGRQILLHFWDATEQAEPDPAVAASLGDDSALWSVFVETLPAEALDETLPVLRARLDFLYPEFDAAAYHYHFQGPVAQAGLEAYHAQSVEALAGWVIRQLGAESLKWTWHKEDIAIPELPACTSMPLTRPASSACQIRVEDMDFCSLKMRVSSAQDGEWCGTVAAGVNAAYGFYATAVNGEACGGETRPHLPPRLEQVMRHLQVIRALDAPDQFAVRARVYAAEGHIDQLLVLGKGGTLHLDAQGRVIGLSGAGLMPEDQLNAATRAILRPQVFEAR